ncbi:MAG: cytochrome P460 family protein [Acidobacteria bacterium]|nr:cytochrome P460 family protein [Acidobacteriota bacterium]
MNEENAKIFGASYGHVYINPIGFAPLKAGVPVPAGTTIVREKLPTKDSTDPELLVAMVKHAPEFDSFGVVGWDFLVFDKKGIPAQRREANNQCYNCHKSQHQKDFLFGRYFLETFKKRTPDPSKTSFLARTRSLINHDEDGRMKN